MKNCMVDLETMGTGGYTAIVSIGAVKFDETGVGETFYRVVDLESCLKAGLKITASTLYWWLEQSEEARTDICSKDRMPLGIALDGFSNFFISGDTKFLWGMGSDFDNAILADAYKAVGRKQPWGYSSSRCYRSLRAQWKEVVTVDPSVLVGAKHNALTDALFQAEHAFRVLKHIKDLGAEV